MAPKAQNEKLIKEACTAYGIAPEHVFASNTGADGVAVIVTNGGTRVRYAEGDKVKPLDAIAITGINPLAKERKVIAGKKK
jgi:hypothetical protein